MWATVRSVLVVSGIAVAQVVAPAGVSPAAVIQQHNAAIDTVLPAGGQLVGVAHPVIVAFKAPVSDRKSAERSIAVRSTPPMSGRFEWVADEVVHWVPDRFWPAHSTVALSVGRFATDFQTGPVVLGIASISGRTFTVSIDGVEPAPPLPTPHHRPHFAEEGVLPASMGRPEFPTPVGRYAVLAKDRTVVMDSSSVGIPIDDPDGYRFPVEHAVRITGRGLYVHAAPWALRSLGLENVSHGCIGLSPDDAEWYFDAVNIGDPVIVQE